MGIGTDDGKYFDSHLEYLLNTARGASDKKFADSKEMASNEMSGDFESRYSAAETPSRMPPEATEKLAGALKMKGSGEVPERGIIDKLTGMDGGERYQTWPERLARSAFTLPGDVLSGKVEPGSIQEIERAADLAGLVVGGPAPVAAKLADGTLGSFAGVKSKTLPKDKLYEAQTMELDATHPDTIYEKTGFFRGADQRWRYEIPDQNLKLNYGRLQGDNEVSVFPPTKNVFGEKIKTNSLGDIIEHPELFKAYPHLSKIKIETMPEGVNSLGMKIGDTIYMNKLHPELFKDVLMHEVQHVIQDHEGFAKGGTVEQFVKEGATADEKKAYSEAFEKYSRLMGEVEARNVESRLRYKTYERQVLPPYRTEDTFRLQQINSK